MQDRFQFRVWDKYTHETPAEEMQFLCFNGCLVDSDGCHHSPDDYIVEQCTGLKDKNGKLIFEGDLIKDKGEIKYQIMWKDARFVAVAIKEFDYMPDNLLNQKWLDIWKIEIIGNIHETKEETK